MYPTQYALNLLKMSKIYETKIAADCVGYGWDCKYIISKSIR